MRGLVEAAAGISTPALIELLELPFADSTPD